MPEDNVKAVSIIPTSDSRLNWIICLTHFPEKIAVVFSQTIKAPVLKSLFKQCKSSGMTVVSDHHRGNGFLPLSQSQLNELGCDAAVYITDCRDSIASIIKKINLISNFFIEEFIVFPGWSNPRWCISHNRSLKPGKISRLIKPVNIIAKIAVIIFRLLKTLNISQHLFSCRIIFAYHDKISFVNFFQTIGPNIRPGIIYTGSFGPLQKFTVELIDNKSNPFAYAKFGFNDFIKQAIQNEKKTLKQLKALSLSRIIVPELLEVQVPELFYDRTMITKHLEGGKPLQSVTDTLLAGLGELIKATQDNNSLTLKKYFDSLVESLHELNCSDIDQKITAIRDGVIAVLEKIALSFDSSIMLPLALSHGDFTRWNIRSDNQRNYVVDWEEASMKPLGHDLLTFILVENLLIHHYKQERIVLIMENEIKVGVLNRFLDENGINQGTVNNSMFGILFFAEVIRYNIWHISMHNQFKYPIKESLYDFVNTSWACMSALLPSPTSINSNK